MQDSIKESAFIKDVEIKPILSDKNTDKMAES